MNNTKCSLLTLAYAFLLCCTHALAVPRDEVWHPARKLQVQLVREAIIRAVESDKQLHRFIDLDSLRSELPYEIDLYFPEAWPGLSISPMTRPFAKLGDWELNFGPDYDDPKNKDNPCFLRRIILRRVKYVPNDKTVDEEYTQVVLEPSGTDPVSNWEEGRVAAVTIEGWYVERFRLKNRGEFSKGRGLKYIAAGGKRADLAGLTIEDASMLHIAFRGRVEHLIPR